MTPEAGGSAVFLKPGIAGKCVFPAMLYRFLRTEGGAFPSSRGSGRRLFATAAVFAAIMKTTCFSAAGSWNGSMRDLPSP
jgi:hypothetical protein